jgi:hypothetical protein
MTWHLYRSSAVPREVFEHKGRPNPHLRLPCNGEGRILRWARVPAPAPAPRALPRRRRSDGTGSWGRMGGAVATEKRRTPPTRSPPGSQPAQAGRDVSERVQQQREHVLLPVAGVRARLDVPTKGISGTCGIWPIAPRSVENARGQESIVALQGRFAGCEFVGQGVRRERGRRAGRWCPQQRARRCVRPSQRGRFPWAYFLCNLAMMRRGTSKSRCAVLVLHLAPVRNKLRGDARTHVPPVPHYANSGAPATNARPFILQGPRYSLHPRLGVTLSRVECAPILMYNKSRV